MHPVFLYAALFLISAVGIAYQVALMRVFSVVQWHHFAYMIISIAMLGFGASGAFLGLLRNRVRGRELRGLRVAAFLAAPSMPACVKLGQAIPFETYELTTQPGQLGYLLALYVVLALPFFFVASCITLAFLLKPDRIGVVYGVNLFGSGAGALAVVGLLHLGPPWIVAEALSLPLVVAYALLWAGRPRRAAAHALLILLVLAPFHSRLLPSSRISPYKPLSYTLQFPDAKVVAEAYSPLSVLTAVRSDLIRETPGQIANYPMSDYGELPEQVGLFFDAGAVSPIHRFDGDLRPFTFLDYVASAAAYRLVDRPRVFVMGAGGGTEVLQALWHGARQVTAAEVDPNVFPMVASRFGEFSGDLYGRPEVRPVLAEGRGYLESHPDERYNLIHIPLFGSFAAAAAGMFALNESYVYTVEALELYLRRLEPDGVLLLTAWIETPPRNAIKLFATAAEACRRLGIREPARHLFFVRSWNNAAIGVSRAPLSAKQVEALRAFCLDRGFDLCWLPGMAPEEANRFTVLDRPVYYEAAKALLSPDREAFYADYLFYVQPATDNRPYFFRFFKWDSLPRLVRGMGGQWIPFVEWGYAALVATLLQGTVASLLLILAPLAVLGRTRGSRGAKRWVFAYFAALGAGYMFLEIAFMQILMRFLAYPLYAVTVVLTSFLIFSGVGSLLAQRFSDRPRPAVTTAALGIAVLSALYLLGLPELFTAGAPWVDGMKMAVATLALAPLATCMGVPFPVGLRRVADRHEALVPWAWGVNGCASVVGAALATLGAVHAGFVAVVALAVSLYALAVLSFWRLTRP